MQNLQTKEIEVVTAAGTAAALRRTQSIERVRRLGIVFGFFVVYGVFALLNHQFMSVANLTAVALQSSINAIIAIGMTLVIISAGIDLSVGSIAGLASVVAATVMVTQGVGAGDRRRACRRPRCRRNQRNAHRALGSGAVHRHVRDAGALSRRGAGVHQRSADLRHSRALPRDLRRVARADSDAGHHRHRVRAHRRFHAYGKPPSASTSWPSAATKKPRGCAALRWAGSRRSST